MSGASWGGAGWSRAAANSEKGVKEIEKGVGRRKVKPPNSYLVGLISSFLQPDVGQSIKLL